MGEERREPGQLLRTAAAVLAARRVLDGEIAKLVDEPLDQDAADRVRTAQARTAAAHRSLCEARGLYGPPPWATDEEPISATIPPDQDPRAREAEPARPGDRP